MRALTLRADELHLALGHVGRMYGANGDGGDVAAARRLHRKVGQIGTTCRLVELSLAREHVGRAAGTAAAVPLARQLDDEEVEDVAGSMSGSSLQCTPSS
ncbi:hypothetical protein [Dietzia lutea]|uniref:Uncharacterized protein n=1 Tax=Dietzia lutea TaxID=546160 RepID=A0A2S1RA70_9ACTN|nr:hypothetical protein [Dietzia lutea]AWH93155.1 hypothetical protein A6035_14315 [Dietzia lutea]